MQSYGRDPLTNWAGNVVFSPARVREPRSVAELQEIVASARRVRVLGAGHSFSRVADTAGELVVLRRLPVDVELDERQLTVTVRGETRFGELAQALHRAGYALPNMGSLPGITLAGGYATGTHGSGSGNGCLATAVVRIGLVAPDGQQRVVSRGDPDFDGLVVGLGCFGAVTEVTLRIVPTYDVAQRVYEGLALAALGEGINEMLANAYSVSVFTTYDDDARVWVKQRDTDPPPDLTWAGARAAAAPRHPIAGLAADACTEQLGVPGPWHERLPHFRADHLASSGAELQSEFLVPSAAAGDAVRSLVGVGPIVRPALQVSEIRAVAADDHWLCPAGGRRSVGFHFTWVRDERLVAPAIAAVQRALADYAPRPHWGKLTTLGAQHLRSVYPRWADHLDLLQRWDPEGKFGNELTDRWFGRDERIG